jgi:nitrogen fixation protein NifB
MLLCLSTNGLVLPENVERIRRYAIDHVTITINALDPEIGARIYRWVYHQRRRHQGAAGAALLIERQLRGLELLTEAGVLCKVNSVLIPGVNDAELIRLNKAIAERGAFLHNIMPLISAPEHGTAFGLAGQRGPTAEELEELRARCAGAGARIMRHCRQCRSDAVGLLDEGCGGGLTVLAAPRPAALRVAVASRAGQRVDMHFGQATTFRVYEVTGEQAHLVEERAVDKYCQGGYGEEERLDVTIRALHGCAAVLVARVGRCPAEALEKAGIEVVTAHAFEDVLGALAAYHRSRAARPAAP